MNTHILKWHNKDPGSKNLLPPQAMAHVSPCVNMALTKWINLEFRILWINSELSLMQFKETITLSTYHEDARHWWVWGLVARPMLWGSHLYDCTWTACPRGATWLIWVVLQSDIAILLFSSSSPTEQFDQSHTQSATVITINNCHNSSTSTSKVVKLCAE